MGKRRKFMTFKETLNTFGTCNITILYTFLLLITTVFCSSSIRSHHHHPPSPERSRDLPILLGPYKSKINSQSVIRHYSKLPVPLRHPPPKLKGVHDLEAAAQTLYDLRGFNIPLAGQQETQRFLRQNDPFTFARYQPQTNRNSQATAPLVFPSFYNHETSSKRPNQVLNIFGHTQHLSQTKYEPANLATNNINAIHHGQPQTFRPSQVDVGFLQRQNNVNEQQITSSFNRNQEFFGGGVQQGRQVPQAQPLRQIQGQGQGQRQKESSEDPFVYVYDDEDYEEGEEEIVDKPQQQINANRVTTSAPSITTAALRSQVIFPSSTIAPNVNRHTPTTSSPSLQHNPNFYNNAQPLRQQQQQQQQQNHHFSHYQFPPFGSTPTITPTPNVEIVPSSERKPPPDQSNAIQPHVRPTPSRVVNDDRFRRPVQQQQQQQQFLRPTPTPSAVTYNQVDQEEEEEVSYEQDPEREILQKLNLPGGPFIRFEEPRPETRLRPVNTLVPKNRVPQEDIVLPPNFPFHDGFHGERVPQNHNRQQPVNGGALGLNNRGEIIRNTFKPQQFQEVTTPIPQHRLRPTQTTPTPEPSRVRNPPQRGNPNQDVQTETPTRTRTRGRPINDSGTKLQTLPPFSAVTSTRRPQTLATTSTTIRTTQPPPRSTTAASYELESDEYYDDDEEYDNLQSQVGGEQPILKPAKTISSNKSPLRPDFHNNRIQELQSPKSYERETIIPKRIRPQSQVTPALQNPFTQKRYREQSTTKKSTTGKPLYNAGRMLAREGGLYAGQDIPLFHQYGYGQPVPSVPSNSFFGRTPSSRPTVRPQPQVVSQAHVVTPSRTRGRDRDTTTPTSIIRTTNPSSRLIHPSRIRPTVHSTSTEREPPSSTEREILRTPRPKGRPQTTPAPEPPLEEEQDISSTPAGRRRKVKPGQGKRLRQQLQSQEQVSVSHSVHEGEDNEDDQDKPEPARKNLRPNLHRPKTKQPIVQVLQSTSTESSSETDPVPDRLSKLRPRPRLTPKKVQKPQEDEDQEQDQEPRTSPTPLVNQKRIRPRPHKVAKLHPEYSEAVSKSVSTSTQASVKIGKKPIPDSNRYSSKFREEATIVTSTHSSVSESDNDEEDNQPKLFSPPPRIRPRPSFKPPKPQGTSTPKPRPKSQKIQQAPKEEVDGEELPPSIRLNSKDVVMNRKPARRIPPGSASDRLKALQEKRKKLLTPQEYRESLRQGQGDEGEESDHSSIPQGQRTLRRRKLLNVQQTQTEEERVEDAPPPAPAPVPPPRRQGQRRVLKQQRKRLRPRPIETEDGDYEGQEQDENRDIQQNKREIMSQPKRTQNNVFIQPQEQEYEDEKPKPKPLKTDRTNARRNPTEVTSDEARSVVGISRPKDNPAPAPQGQGQGQGQPEYYEEEDYEGHPSQTSENKQSSPSTSTSTTTEKITTYRNKDEEYHEYQEPEQEEQLPSPHETSTETPEEPSTTAAYLKARLRPNKKLLSSIRHKQISSSREEQSERSKLLKFKTSASTNSPLSSHLKKSFTMATEDPSLPLEEMFLNVKKSQLQGGN